MRLAGIVALVVAGAHLLGAAPAMGVAPALDDDAGSGMDAGDVDALALPVGPGTFRGMVHGPVDAQDVYTFEATAGDIVVFDLVPLDKVGVFWEVAGPDGRVWYTTFGDEDHRLIALPATGAWYPRVLDLTGAAALPDAPDASLPGRRYEFSISPPLAGSGFGEAFTGGARMAEVSVELDQGEVAGSVRVETPAVLAGPSPDQFADGAVAFMLVTEIALEARIEGCDCMFGFEWSSLWYGQFYGTGVRVVTVTPEGTTVETMQPPFDIDLAPRAAGFWQSSAYAGPDSWSSTRMRFLVLGTPQAPLTINAAVTGPGELAASGPLETITWYDDEWPSAGPFVSAPGLLVASERARSLDVPGPFYGGFEALPDGGTMLYPDGSVVRLGHGQPVAFVNGAALPGVYEARLNATAQVGMAHHARLVGAFFEPLGVFDG